MYLLLECFTIVSWKMFDYKLLSLRSADTFLQDGCNGHLVYRMGAKTFR